MTHLTITTAMRQALDAVERAERDYVPGRDSSAMVEIPKLALADATITAVRQQAETRLARLPQRATPTPVVDVELRRKRRSRG